MHARARGLVLAFAIAAIGILPANAAFHRMSVVEVFAGTPASPSAQYVVLQMYSASQNFVGGHSIQVFSATNVSLGTFTFPGSVANGANQSRILIATSEAESFFGITANLAMSAVIPLDGGKVCFDSIDCVAWGSYSGSSTGVGTPFNATGGGLRQGKSIQRRLDIAGGATTLDATDDTGDSANDFVFGLPTPRNNAGASGSAPNATCGNAQLEGLEFCDDGNTTGGDGCRADCAGLETCGDGLTDADAGETCDDGNQADGDGCPGNCGVVAAAVPAEASPTGDMLAAPAAAPFVNLTFEPACSATDHAVYWGLGPIDGAVAWIDAACELGASGSASFATTDLLPGELLYFVIVGYDDEDEGTYGKDSASIERPEATGIGACDRPASATTCN